MGYLYETHLHFITTCEPDIHQLDPDGSAPFAELLDYCEVAESIAPLHNAPRYAIMSAFSDNRK